MHINWCFVFFFSIYRIILRRYDIDVYQDNVALPDDTTTSKTYGHKSTIGTWIWEKHPKMNTCETQFQEIAIGMGYFTDEVPKVGSVFFMNNTIDNKHTAHKLTGLSVCCGFPCFNTDFGNVKVYLPAGQFDRYDTLMIFS